MVTVLITTSGTGSRLGSITKYMNKSLVKIGDMYAICHILGLYDEDTHFVITVGYYGQQVIDFLKNVYPEKRFSFVWVDCYEGPGSSLVYSIRKAKAHLQEPFFFHCCDTIFEESLSIQEANTVWVSSQEDFQTYAGIQGKDGEVVAIHKKGNPSNDYIYTGVSHIVAWRQFWEALEAVYESDPQNSALSDVDVMREMMGRGERFTFKVADSFCDTGNPESLDKTRKRFNMKYHVLEKDNESLCFVGKKVAKFINDKEVNRKRYWRGLDLSPAAPKIFAHTENFLFMELVGGEVLSDVKEYGEVKKLLEWAESNLWTGKDVKEEYRASCMRFYKEKTVARLKSLKILHSEKERVNGISTGSIWKLLDTLQFESLATDTFYRFHGDFILDNILKRANGEYCLLDWRHEFDIHLYKGDKYYDLAKLRHNIIFNHKNILAGLYSVEESQDSVTIDLKCNYFLMRQLEEFDTFLDAHGYDRKKARILSAIIWLNMAPLYDPPLSTFLFYFGKMNLFLEMMNS